MKKKHLLVVLLFTTTFFNINESFSQIIQNQTESKLIPSGTQIKVKSLLKVKGKKLKIGKELAFATIEPIVLNGVILANSGSQIMGRVVKIKKSRALGRQGEFEFCLEYLQLTDGTVVKFTNNISVEGKNYLANAIIASFIVTPFMLFMHGTEGVIKKGQPFIGFTK